MSWLIIVAENGEPVPKKIIFKDRLNPLETLSDEECIQRFRMDRTTIVDLCQLLYEDLVRPTRRHGALPVITQICAALRTYAQAAFYRVTGDSVGMSNAALSETVHTVAAGLSRRAGNFIKFPQTPAEIGKTKNGFMAIGRFPNMLGAIDCTHIEILSPAKEIEASYVNRKGWHSINVQAVANATLEFTNVLAAFPGRVHDSFIWTQCHLKRRLDNSHINGWLLGDAGYPLEPHLLTPYGNPITEQQKRYNSAHSKTRNTIERAFGVLKMRYRCLDKT
ncbi:putative nuclease HARBI1 [Oppia nitens]|uniref:putative nuclease HARBI1 n=1 Tax=Oppia nitens TaxID=1686743 RepID=UPI0023DBAD1B|nr:putative nuclease HARBI1 [Oppia nitens]